MSKKELKRQILVDVAAGHDVPNDLQAVPQDLVYVGGPYAGSPQQIERNVQRARRLGQHAVSLGHTPMVPHLLGHAGLYGSPTESDDGSSRRNSLRCGTHMASIVGGASGAFWAIQVDDGSLSSGTYAEMTAYEAASPNPRVVTHTWAQWLELFGEHEEPAATTVVNLHVDEYDVYIGRAGHGQDGYFGNPFAQPGARVPHWKLVADYRAYFLERIYSDPEFRRRVLELKGKRLGCFCKPRVCHGDVIVEWLEKGEGVERRGVTR